MLQVSTATLAMLQNFMWLFDEFVFVKMCNCWRKVFYELSDLTAGATVRAPMVEDTGTELPKTSR